jgi:hypothetical protein
LPEPGRARFFLSSLARTFRDHVSESHCPPLAALKLPPGEDDTAH